MNYFWISSKDSRKPTFILIRHDGSLRTRYQSLRCEGCGKFNEYRAIREQGIEPDITINAASDIFESADGLLCIGPKALCLLETESIRGLEYIAIQSSEYVIGIPTSVVAVRSEFVGLHAREEVDWEAVARTGNWNNKPVRTTIVETNSCGMEFHDRCKTCGRFRYSLYWPMLKTLEIPADERCLFTPELFFERERMRETFLFTSETVRNLMINAGLTGAEFNEVQ